jgi:hypothetical protein
VEDGRFSRARWREFHWRWFPRGQVALERNPPGRRETQKGSQR